jgi:hypothetical protein
MADRRRRASRASGDQSLPVPAWPPADSVAASGSTIATLPSPSRPTEPLETRATYRILLRRGLEPDEAANLTAFLAGLALGERPWTLAQVNRLLFLRELVRAGQFGHTDGDRIH